MFKRPGGGSIHRFGKWCRATFGNNHRIRSRRMRSSDNRSEVVRIFNAIQRYQ